MKIELKKYVPTPTAKFIGIAEIMLDDKILIRYKITEAKEGKGKFPAMASYCIEQADGNLYLPAVVIDSRIIEEEIKSKIMAAVKNNHAQPRAASQPSIFQEAQMHDKKAPFFQEVQIDDEKVPF